MYVNNCLTFITGNTILEPSFEVTTSKSMYVCGCLSGFRFCRLFLILLLYEESNHISDINNYDFVPMKHYLKKKKTREPDLIPGPSFADTYLGKCLAEHRW